MSVQMFLALLFAFSVVSSLVTEAIKKILSEKENVAYNIVVLIVSMIIGCGGCFVYYILKDIGIDIKTIIYAILMGFATTLAATLGYDKVKQTIEQITKSEK